METGSRTPCDPGPGKRVEESRDCMTDGSGGLEGAKAAERGTPRPSPSTAKSLLPQVHPAGSLFLATGWYQQRGLGISASLFSQLSVPTQGAQKVLEG